MTHKNTSPTSVRTSVLTRLFLGWQSLCEFSLLRAELSAEELCAVSATDVAQQVAMLCSKSTSPKKGWD